MKKLLTATLLILFTLPSFASELPSCPEGTYHNCFGTYTWADGSSYVGEWKDNKRHGQGTNTWADGREISGIWDDSEYLYKSVEKNLFEFLSNT